MDKNEKRDFYKTKGIFGLVNNPNNIPVEVIQKELQDNIENLLDKKDDSLVDIEKLFSPKTRTSK